MADVERPATVKKGGAVKLNSMNHFLWTEFSRIILAVHEWWSPTRVKVILAGGGILYIPISEFSNTSISEIMSMSRELNITDLEKEEEEKRLKE